MKLWPHQQAGLAAIERGMRVDFRSLEGKTMAMAMSGTCPNCGRPGNHFEPAFRGEREYFRCEVG